MGAVEPPVGLDTAGDERLDLGRTGHVGSHEARLAPGLGNQPHGLLAGLGRHIGHHNLRPFAGKGQGRRPADARPPAGDQRNLVGD